jgi:hypothetical protein
MLTSTVVFQVVISTVAFTIRDAVNREERPTQICERLKILAASL